MVPDSCSPWSPSSCISPSSPQQSPPPCPPTSLPRRRRRGHCAVLSPSQRLGPRVPPDLEHLEDPPVHGLGPPLPVIQGVEGPHQDLGRGLRVQEQRPVLLTWGRKRGGAGVRGCLGLRETLSLPSHQCPPPLGRRKKPRAW